MRRDLNASPNAPVRPTKYTYAVGTENFRNGDTQVHRVMMYTRLIECERFVLAHRYDVHTINQMLTLRLGRLTDHYLPPQSPILLRPSRESTQQAARNPAATMLRVAWVCVMVFFGLKRATSDRTDRTGGLVPVAHLVQARDATCIFYAGGHTTEKSPSRFLRRRINTINV